MKQLGLVDVAALRVNGNAIEIRLLKRSPREGWARNSKRLAATGAGVVSRPAVATGKVSPANLDPTISS